MSRASRFKKPTRIPGVIVPLVRTFIVFKVSTGKSHFAYTSREGDKPIRVPAKRFVSAFRIGPDQIALTMVVRFPWREASEGTKTEIHDWLDRWDQPDGKPPIYLRKRKIPKRLK